MTEEEKIFAGYIFNNRAPELVAMKHKAHNACLRFNQMDEYDPLRQPIIKEFIGSIGTVYYFQGPIQFNYGCHTFIGENFFANFNLTVMDDARIYIGDNVCFGPNVSLMATNHPLLPQERPDRGYCRIGSFHSHHAYLQKLWERDHPVSRTQGEEVLFRCLQE